MFSWGAVAGATNYSAKIQLAVPGSSQTEKLTASTSVAFTGLTAGTKYFIGVLGFQGEVIGHWSGAACTTTATAIPGPPVVACGTATSSSITVGWTAPAQAAKYQASRGNGWVQTTGTHHTFSFLDANTSYTISVQAGNTVGWSESGTWTCSTTTAPLPAPTGIACMATDTSISVTWNAVTGATKYSAKLQLAVPGSTQTIQETTATAATFTGLTPETEYFIGVLGIQGEVIGHWSGVNCTTPPAPVFPEQRCAASTPKATKVKAARTGGGKTMSMSWTNPAGISALKIVVVTGADFYTVAAEHIDTAAPFDTSWTFTPVVPDPHDYYAYDVLTTVNGTCYQKAILYAPLKLTPKNAPPSPTNLSCATPVKDPAHDNRWKTTVSWTASAETDEYRYRHRFRDKASTDSADWSEWSDWAHNPGAAATIGGLGPDSSYGFEVQAANAAGWGAAATATCVTGAALGVPADCKPPTGITRYCLSSTGTTDSSGPETTSVLPIAPIARMRVKSPFSYWHPGKQERKYLWPGDWGGLISWTATIGNNTWVSKDALVGGTAQLRNSALVLDNAQVYGQAQVVGRAAVYGNAKVFEQGRVSEDAQVYENAHVRGNDDGDTENTWGGDVHDDAHVYGYAVIGNSERDTTRPSEPTSARVYGNARVFGQAKVYNTARVYGYAEVLDHAEIYNSAQVEGHKSSPARVYGSARVFEQGRVSEHAQVYGHAHVRGWDGDDTENEYGGDVYDNARIYGKAVVGNRQWTLNDPVGERSDVRVYGYARVGGESRLYGSAEIYDKATIRGSTHVYGRAQVYGFNTKIVGTDVRIYDDARIYSNAYVLDSYTGIPKYLSVNIEGAVTIRGRAVVCNGARVVGTKVNKTFVTVSGSPDICGAPTYGYNGSTGNLERDHKIHNQVYHFDSVELRDQAEIYGHTKVHHNARIFDRAKVYGNATICHSAQIYDSAKVYENSSICGSAQVFDEAQVYGAADVHGHAWVFDSAYGVDHAGVAVFPENDLARVFWTSAPTIYTINVIDDPLSQFELVFTEDGNHPDDIEGNWEKNLTDEDKTLLRKALPTDAEIDSAVKSTKVYGEAVVNADARIWGGAVVIGGKIEDESRISGGSFVSGGRTCGDHWLSNHYPATGWKSISPQCANPNDATKSYSWAGCLVSSGIVTFASAGAGVGTTVVCGIVTIP